MTYLQNKDDGLWYPVVLTGTGADMALAWGDVGVATPPPYVPTEGEPLVSQAQYEAVTSLAVADVAQWRWIALMVSDSVESYLCRSYRVAQVPPLTLECDTVVAAVTPVPMGLVAVVCLCIRDALKLAQGQTNAGMKSETLRGYSYTLADTVAATDTVSAYAQALRPWRRLFLGA